MEQFFTQPAETKVLITITALLLLAWLVPAIKAFAQMVKTY